MALHEIGAPWWLIWVPTLPTAQVNDRWPSARHTSTAAHWPVQWGTLSIGRRQSPSHMRRKMSPRTEPGRLALIKRISVCAWRWPGRPCSWLGCKGGHLSLLTAHLCTWIFRHQPLSWAVRPVWRPWAVMFGSQMTVRYDWVELVPVWLLKRCAWQHLRRI